MIKTNKTSLLLFPVSAIGFQLLCILDLHETMVFCYFSDEPCLETTHCNHLTHHLHSQPGIHHLNNRFSKHPCLPSGGASLVKAIDLGTNFQVTQRRSGAVPTPETTRHKTNNFPVGNGHESHKCLDEGQQFSVICLFFLERSICASPAFEPS